MLFFLSILLVLVWVSMFSVVLVMFVCGCLGFL